MQSELESVKKEHDVVKVFASAVLPLATYVNVCLLELPDSSSTVQFKIKTISH